MTSLPVEPAERPGHVPLRRLRLSTRSILVTFTLFGVALVGRTVVSRSHRVIGWLIAAVLVAGLLHPIVDRLSRYMRRGFALVVVIIGVVGSVSFLTYNVVDSVRIEMRRLQRVAPDAAARIEQSRRFGQAARDFGLQDRVTEFVDQLPKRLAGGDTTEAIRSAASRSVAYLAAAVLTLFVLGHGPRIVSAGLNQIRDDARRTRLKRELLLAYARTWNYVAVQLVQAVVIGVFTTVVCRIADIPGAAALGLFVGAFSVVPYLGIILGSIPIGLLALGLRSGALALLLFAVFMATQVIDAVVMRHRLHKRSVNVGPAITLIVVMLGFELYGVGGAIAGLAIATFAVALADEIADEIPGDEPLDPVAVMAAEVPETAPESGDR